MKLEPCVSENAKLIAAAAREVVGCATDCERFLRRLLLVIDPKHEFAQEYESDPDKGKSWGYLADHVVKGLRRNPLRALLSEAEVDDLADFLKNGRALRNAIGHGNERKLYFFYTKKKLSIDTSLNFDSSEQRICFAEGIYDKARSDLNIYAKRLYDLHCDIVLLNQGKPKWVVRRRLVEIYVLKDFGLSMPADEAIARMYAALSEKSDFTGQLLRGDFDSSLPPWASGRLDRGEQDVVLVVEKTFRVEKNIGVQLRDLFEWGCQIGSGSEGVLHSGKITVHRRHLPDGFRSAFFLLGPFGDITKIEMVIEFAIELDSSLETTSTISAQLLAGSMALQELLQNELLNRGVSTCCA